MDITFKYAISRLIAITCVFATCFLPSVALAQSADPVPQSIQVDVVYLSSDLLEGRESGTRGAALASDYIADRFKDLGLSPAGIDGWFQPFPFKKSVNPHSSDGEHRMGRNVVGFLGNGARTTVVIGAHYDHLGYGGFGSREPDSNEIHNGADDNASGVAGLLEIARQLTASGARNNNYLFVAFSAEELGLIGSKFFVNSDLRTDREINYMINLDMVGRLNESRALAVSGTGTSPSWDAALDAIETDLAINKHTSGLGPSDHASFYLNDLPVLHLFTGQHEDYHKSGDDSQLINYEGIFSVASFSVDLIQELNGEGSLAFENTVDESQTRTSFKVSLGVMPDYVSSGDGVRLDAVMDGRPGAAAGLVKGDIVIKLGDVDVSDINAYMVALSKLNEGDVVTVVIKRGDETLEKIVRF